MIEVSHLSKKYGNFLAVHDVSFSVGSGEIVGFLGPNGAGKSTIMNIITGYLSLSEGEVKIDGFDITRDPEKAKKRIGYLPEIPPLYPDMKVKEYLNFLFDLKRVKMPRTAHIDEIMEITGLKTHQNRLIKNLSKGYRQRVGLGGALIGNPDVLILDEPTVGLDPKQIIEIRSLIKRLGENHTVIISSHILSEIQAVCEKVIIINGGHLVAKGNITELSESLSADKTVSLCAVCDKAALKTALENIPGAEKVEEKPEKTKGACRFVITPKSGEDIRSAVFDAVVNLGGKILELSANAVTLEQIFLLLTENAENADAISMLKTTNKKEDETDDGDI